MMKHVEINGKKMTYTDQGEGLPVIFAHSFLWSHRQWDPQVAEFSKNYRCIAVDMWNHGSSDTIDSDEYTLEQLAKDYAAFIEALGIKSCIFVGLSVGGMIALHLGLKRPDLFKGLVVCGSYVGAEPNESRAEYLALFETMVKLKFFNGMMIDKFAPFFFSPKTMAANLPIVGAFKQDLSNIPPQNIPGIFSIGKGIFNRRDILDQLPQISVPTLYVVGEDDLPRPPEETKIMADKTPESRVAMLADAGHICNLENPQDFNKHMAEFLSAYKH
ncbi:MAG: alpha/beta fold hydrolase [Alphaproteobacteria bacterium]